MEWLTSIRTAIDYIEEHLTDNISAQDVTDRVYGFTFWQVVTMGLINCCLRVFGDLFPCDSSVTFLLVRCVHQEKNKNT